MIQTIDTLVSKKCRPCEGEASKYSVAEAEEQLAGLSGWRLTHDGQRIRKDWKMKSFLAGVDFFARVAQVAENDGHHPDLHLEGYRNLWVELSTHSVGGLTENDFILAAKIDQVPVEARP